MFRLNVGLVGMVDDEEGLREVVFAEEDFVWAAGDPRWVNKSIEDIAAEQVAQVKEVFASREAVAETNGSNIAELPGTTGLEL